MFQKALQLADNKTHEVWQKVTLMYLTLYKHNAKIQPFAHPPPPIWVQRFPEKALSLQDKWFAKSTHPSLISNRLICDQFKLRVTKQKFLLSSLGEILE